jgi:hypothetical protein
LWFTTVCLLGFFGRGRRIGYRTRAALFLVSTNWRCISSSPLVLLPSKSLFVRAIFPVADSANRRLVT